MVFVFSGHLYSVGTLCKFYPLFRTEMCEGASMAHPPVLKLLIVVKHYYVFSYPENSFITFCSLDLASSRVLLSIS